MKLIRYVLFLMISLEVCGDPFTWPTPYSGEVSHAMLEQFIQPTASGKAESGLYGCARSEGNQFHEALDILPVNKRRSGEPTDAVFAALDGRVVYINSVAGDSAFGRYMVIEHGGRNGDLVTLYAHLKEIRNGLSAGSKVTAGERIGVMGRSASYGIPKARAHLHFEIGLRLTNQFQSWYDRQEFGSKNEHGVFNGYNLIGLDPLKCYEWLSAHRGKSVLDYLKEQAVGVLIEVKSSSWPDFVDRYPELTVLRMPRKEIAGWRISVTGWGMPIKMEGLSRDEIADMQGSARVVGIDRGQLDTYSCREIVTENSHGVLLGSEGRQLLEILFGFK